jgi:hypothetical protein
MNPKTIVPIPFWTRQTVKMGAAKVSALPAHFCRFYSTYLSNLVLCKRTMSLEGSELLSRLPIDSDRIFHLHLKVLIKYLRQRSAHTLRGFLLPQSEHYFHLSRQCLPILLHRQKNPMHSSRRRTGFSMGLMMRNWCRRKYYAQKLRLWASTKTIPKSHPTQCRTANRVSVMGYLS